MANFLIALFAFHIVSVQGVTPAENLPPTVRFTQPAPDSIFNRDGPPSVLRLEATDAEGDLRVLRIFQNGILVMESRLSPFEYHFTPLQSGVYTFTAEAVETHGATTSATPLRITIRGAENHWHAALPEISGTNFSEIASTLTASREKDEPLHAGLAGGKSVWWAWRAPQSGTAVFDTEGSDFDTLLAVYILPRVKTVRMTDLTLIAANDDDPLVAPASRVKFTATQGTLYYIAVDGREGVAGTARLTLGLNSIDRLANDLFVNATPIHSRRMLTGSNFGAVKEAGEPAHAGNPGGASVWWRFQASSLVPFQISLEGSSFDTLLAVYTNRSGASTPTDLQLVASNDDGEAGSLFSQVRFQPPIHAIYWIAVDGYNGASGEVQIHVQPALEGIVRPANDHFADAERLAGAAAIAHAATRWATQEPGDVFGTHSVWWRWAAPQAGPTYLSTKGSGFDTTLGVFTGSRISALTRVASNDDDPAGGKTSALVFQAERGTEYFIALAGYQSANGQAVLALNQPLLLAPGPRLLSLWGKGVFSVEVQSSSGSFIVEKSQDLATWRLAGTISGTKRLNVIPPPSGGHEFFRVRVLE